MANKQAWDLLVSSDDGVLRYDGATGAFKGVFTVGGGLEKPTGIRFGPDGNLYVSNVGPDNVLRFNGVTGAFMDIVASNSDLTHPRQIGFVDDQLFVSSRGTHNVLTYKIPTREFIECFTKGNPSTGAVFEHPLREPFGLLYGPDGNLYVASYGTNAVLRYEGRTGNFVDIFASGGELLNPRNIVWGPDGHFYVTSANHRVLRFEGRAGTFMDTFVTPESGNLNDPYGLEFGGDGNLYVSSGKTNSVLRYDGTTGDFLDAFIPPGSGGLRAPTYMVFVGGLAGKFDPERWRTILA